MAFTQESEPLSDMKDLLNNNWIVTEATPLPELVIVNDPDEAISRVDFSNGNDCLIISMGGAENIKMRGNWSYYDHVYPIVLNYVTDVDRQRIRDAAKVVRMILMGQKHHFPNYQLIRPLSYRELVGQDVSIWRFEFALQVESHGEIAEVLGD